ncbi:16S rRNA (adenine1518-N6/adenine1519-N6)-dimethyltransferase [Methanomicrobium sp. W14]|uniref:16S rRNA (adenine(1518)-N(6)/adenine(1519)-N(6))- dimethyltransferase RsmA n=1 Tax=Methanomicrobium sp. W14 TaxID=2817839 RepID=UPI001AEAC410|nr:16S rRNA (adenine(1518)-N(6)/adenine(1519)-N(6))-dimethyltransferase RsmA [Methanomicrobium sp. W14]MBP2132873.1 16S rRNA (adenine1518-N6/adenine1519-N6)-dimethyltransferase [Methanomicrobium sp. W14]
MRALHDQHFLCDDDAVKKISEFTDVKGVKVLEIGPGRGVLTKALLDRGAEVTAIELDGTLIPCLEIFFKKEIESGRLKIIHGDAAKCVLPEFDKVVANLPYSVSSKITFRLLGKKFSEAVLMYQKEFAERMIALPGTADCGRLSVMVQTYAKVMPLLELKPGSFSPPPEVDSWVVRITPKKELTYQIDDKEFYSDLVRELFSLRRKTIRKALKISSKKLGEKNVERIFENIPEELLQKRPEELTLKEFSFMSNIAKIAK